MVFPITVTAAARPDSVLPSPKPVEAPPPAVIGALSPRSRSTDRVILSPEAEFQKEQAMVKAELERQERMEKEQSSLLKAILDPNKPAIPTESMGKCVTIAGRMMRGDSISPAEEEYLSGNAPQLYQQAVLMRQTGGEKGEGHTDLLDDEDLAHGEAAMVMNAVRPELRRIFDMLSEEDMAAAIFE